MHPLLLILAEATNSSTIFMWLPTISAIIVALITGIVSWKANNSKEKTDQFSALMEESADFRKELKEDRNQIKLDLLEAKKDLNLLREELEECNKKLQLCHDGTTEVLEHLKRQDD